jgi:hypothetical protein
MALSYGLSLNAALVYSIQHQCTLANYIISVERLNHYMHIKSEAKEIVEENRPPLNWPVAGKVEINDLKVILAYFQNAKHHVQKKCSLNEPHNMFIFTMSDTIQARRTTCTSWDHMHI